MATFTTRWYVSDGSASEYLSGPFDTEDEAQDYADVMNSRWQEETPWLVRAGLWLTGHRGDRYRVVERDEIEYTADELRELWGDDLPDDL